MMNWAAAPGFIVMPVSVPAMLAVVVSEAVIDCGKPPVQPA
jgi:hypothetical protein